MKRGYALKEISKGKKKENKSQRRPGKCASPKCHYYSIFVKHFIMCTQVTSVTVDGWPNSLILASPSLNFLLQRQRIKSVHIVQAQQRSSQVEKQGCSTVKSEPMQEIREALGRRKIKRKQERKGLLVQMNPIKKKKKCQVYQAGQAIFMLQKQACEQFCRF